MKKLLPFLLTFVCAVIFIRPDAHAGIPAQLSVDRNSLSFSAEASGSGQTASQQFFISNAGGIPLNWAAEQNKSWLLLMYNDGTVEPGESFGVDVSVNPMGLAPGTYTGTVTVTGTEAYSNDPVGSATITVTLNVIPAAQDNPPFGAFNTPLDGSTVRSSIPVTGWALDDVGVDSVKIYREGGSGSMVYIGDASMVEGARPDVEAAYPGMPNNSRAGWGYMLLTNFLPDGGNGTYTLYAIAKDTAGNETNLGSKTIHCDNANAVKPFGAIDTPTQGGTASGASYINWGWALTPQPNTIPTDGSTIYVWVDGIRLGHLSAYNIYRSDIANLFPGYTNSNGAAGYFILDTTQYSTGVHTIMWTAEDNAGNKDGIGSRYFTINNSGSRSSAAQDPPTPNRSVVTGTHTVMAQITGNTVDFQGDAVVTLDLAAEIPSPNPPGNSDIFLGFQVINGLNRPLPAGVTLNTATGQFAWQPGPAAHNTYTLRFIRRSLTAAADASEVFTFTIDAVSLADPPGPGEDIPTVSEWGLMILAAFFAGLSLFRLMRRTQTSA